MKRLALRKPRGRHCHPKLAFSRRSGRAQVPKKLLKRGLGKRTLNPEERNEEISHCLFRIRHAGNDGGCPD
jgi:hypothetical protein